MGVTINVGIIKHVHETKYLLEGTKEGGFLIPTMLLLNFTM
jgi:hypothetical protein